MSARARMELALGRAWRGEAPVLSASLLPVSWAWALGAMTHRGLYASGLLHREKAIVPVISVGNLVVGGAGKTPVTLELARRLLAAGRRVAVLSRGYGRRSGERVVIVSDGQAVRATAEEGGDEPVWLARRLPGLIVAVASERAEAASAAIELGADLLILDDGFSHHALARDADVLVVDDELRFGNGRVLPAGPLREPRGAAKRASFVWLTRCRTKDAMPPRGLEGLPVVRSRYEPAAITDLDLRPAGKPGALAGVRVLAVCGIARPKSFEATLAGLGANVRELAAFPDHHPFDRADVEQLERQARAERCELIVTTEKDAIRLALHSHGDHWRALRMELEVAGDTSALDAFVRHWAPGVAEVAP